jgi:hypothetical protein
MDHPPKLAGRLAGCAVLPPMEDGRKEQEPSPPPPRFQSRVAPPAKSPAVRADRRRTRNRFETLNAFVDLTAGKLNRSELLVWLTLYRDARDGIARTAQSDLARRTQLGTRTVRWAVKRLEGRGLLVVVRRGGLRSGPSTYRVSAVDMPS